MVGRDPHAWMPGPQGCHVLCCAGCACGQRRRCVRSLCTPTSPPGRVPCLKRPLTCSSAADGRHLDAYDSHAAQYWPALRLFLSTLGPAQPLPPLPAAEGAAEGAAQPQLQSQLGKALQPPQEQEMVSAAAVAAGGEEEARKER